MKILGLDLGTTTLSAVVLDSESGDVCETVSIPNAADMEPRHAFERIQDPDAIARKARSLVESIKAKTLISAIGIDGQMHGILYTDRNGRAVSPLFTWQDRRGEEKPGDTTYAGELGRRTGCPVATGYGIVTHFWHVMNGKVPENAERLCTINDYVGMRLTGRTAPLMHVSDAASVGLFDAAAGRWDEASVRRAGLDASILPEVTGQCAPIGCDPDGIPVACAIGDNQASFIGAMREMEGGVLVNMGTGGQISLLTRLTKAAGDLEVRPLENGKSILVGSALCGGRSYALLERFLRSCARLAGADSGPLYEQMNRLGLGMLDRAGLPAVDTRFNGTRAMPELRGSIAGLCPENFDAGHLIAGTLMGMAREIHGLYELMLAQGASPATHLVGSGNAIRRNPALKLAFERVFDMKMQLPAHEEEAACGAALFGMTAAGIAPSLEQAQKLIRYAD